MPNVRAKSLSTSLSSTLEARVREIAVKENRSVANVMENAVRVFTRMPKNARDLLVETSSEEPEARERFDELTRVMMYHDAWKSFEESSRLVASQIRSDGVADYDDAEIVEGNAA